MKNSDLGTRNAQAIAGLHGSPFGAELRRDVRKSAKRFVRRHGHAFPDRVRAEAAHGGISAADVVGITVRDDEGVKRADAERAQRATDDSLADVETGTFGRILQRPNRETTGVDKEGFAVWQQDEGRITLPDIEEHDAHLIGTRQRHGAAARAMRACDDDDGGEECEAGSRATTDTREAISCSSQAERGQKRNVVGTNESPSRWRDLVRDPRRKIDELR